MGIGVDLLSVFSAHGTLRWGVVSRLKDGNRIGRVRNSTMSRRLI